MNIRKKNIRTTLFVAILLLPLILLLSTQRSTVQAEQLETAATGSDRSSDSSNGGSEREITATPIPEPTPRDVDIVGGRPADPGEWPWQVLVRPGAYLCGGSLVAPNWILTAAHCVYDVDGELFHPSDITVILGEHDRMVPEGSEQVQTVVEVIAHENYSSWNNDNDIALLRLATAATLNDRVAPVALLTSPVDDGYTEPGDLATVTGWGVTAESGNVATVLMEVAVPIVSNATCNRSYGLITDNMICAGYKDGGKDSCSGDSGGPLVVPDNSGSWRLTGIVSFGHGCARENFYGVYTRVSRYVAWIQQHTGTEQPTPTSSPTPLPPTPLPPTLTKTSTVIHTPTSTQTKAPTTATPTKTPVLTTTPIVSPTSTNSPTPVVSPTMTPTPTVTPTDSPLTATLEPESVTELSYAVANGGRVTIFVPAGAVDESVTLYFDVQDGSMQTSQHQIARRTFQLTVYDEALILHDYVFAVPLEITVQYTEKTLSGLDEERLTLFAYDPVTEQWSEGGVEVFDHDLVNNYLSADIWYPAIYALGTADAQIYLPLVVR